MATSYQRVSVRTWRKDSGQCCHYYLVPGLSQRRLWPFQTCHWLHKMVEVYYGLLFRFCSSLLFCFYKHLISQAQQYIYYHLINITELRYSLQTHIVLIYTDGTGQLWRNWRRYIYERICLDYHKFVLIAIPKSSFAKLAGLPYEHVMRNFRIVFH